MIHIGFQSISLYLWFYGDLTMKLIFLIWLIHRSWKGKKMPKPHHWLLEKFSNWMWSCLKCKHQAGDIWSDCPKKCRGRWYGKPTAWEAKDGKD